jgi:hypothetical protein
MMGQSMLGWKADDFFFSFRQHLDSLGPRGLEDLRLALAKAATNVASVFRRLNNEHIGRILENVQATTKNLQQLDVNTFHEALKSVQHTSNVATDKLTQLEITHLHDTLKSVQLMVNIITKNVKHLDVEGFNEALKLIQHVSNATAHKLVQLNLSHPHDTFEIVQQITSNITLATQNLPKALDTFKYILLFTGLMILLATWTFVRVMRNLDKRTNKISANIQVLGTEIIPQGNLHHQSQFAAAVWNFVQLKQTEQSLYPDHYPVTNDPSEARYVIFNPASDWHAGFFALGTGDWDEKVSGKDQEDLLIKCVRLFNNPERLATYLHDYDKSGVIKKTDKTRSVTHILLPSTHTYTLPFTLRIPQGLYPVKVVGQTDRNGKPYCSARIIGVDPSDVVDVDLLSESKATDHVPSSFAPDTRIYPLLWLVIAALWSKDMIGKVVDLVGDVVWTVWNAYLGLTDLLSPGVTKFLPFGAT